MSSRPPRHGLRRGWIRLSGALTISLLLVLLLSYGMLRLRPDAQRHPNQRAVVRIYCAAGVAKPLERVIADYNQRYDTQVELVRTGGSGELAGQVRTEHEVQLAEGADLYLTADALLLEELHESGVIAELFPLAEQRPVIAVAAGSSLEIADLRQLVAAPQLRFGVASENAAVGKLVRRIAKQQGILEELESRKTTDAENVMTLAQAVVTGALDVAIIWDTTVHQLNAAQPESVLQTLALADPRDETLSHIAVGVCTNSDQATQSLRFCRFLTSREAADAFNELGFTFLEGDAWAEIPEVHLYCGSMFTPVLEDAVEAFAKREGVNLYPRWEGCGKLVASMESMLESDLFPDGYLACDEQFLEAVADQFEAAMPISRNELVLVSRRELASPVNSVEDLLAERHRVGICDPELSALGLLTQQALGGNEPGSQYHQLQSKAVVTVDVGPTLISQLMAGGLDAAIVYRSNVMADDNARASLRVRSLGGNGALEYATQPWAISRSTPYPALMERFCDWIHQREVQDRFQKLGFEPSAAANE